MAILLAGVDVNCEEGGHGSVYSNKTVDDPNNSLAVSLGLNGKRCHSKRNFTTKGRKMYFFVNKNLFLREGYVSISRSGLWGGDIPVWGQHTAFLQPTPSFTSMLACVRSDQQPLLSFSMYMIMLSWVY